MSKVICDVCGTTYPETAAQCPICGCAKSSVNQTAAANPDQKTVEDSSGYAYVKGGRFSKKNVRKRNSGKAPERRSSGKNQKQEESGNGVLIAIIVVLVIAIFLVAFHLVKTHFLSKDSMENTRPTGSSQTRPATKPTGNTEGTVPGDRIPCQSLEVSKPRITFPAAGLTWTLEATALPADTTDSITFSSSDESVVTVSSGGIVMAVGPGEAKIIVTCGDVVEECAIYCIFGETPNNPDNPSNPDEPDDPAGPEFNFTFNSSNGEADVSLFQKGEKWRAYRNDLDIAAELINWISDDPSVCTVDKGIVTAVGPGVTKIHAEYNGISYSCIVRCNFNADTGDNGDDTDNGETDTVSYKINKTDVSIVVGEAFTLKLTDSEGNAVDVTWVADKPNCVSISGNKITGVESGTTNVSVTYEGKTYTCIVRVK